MSKESEFNEALKKLDEESSVLNSRNSNRLRVIKNIEKKQGEARDLERKQMKAEAEAGQIAVKKERAFMIICLLGVTIFMMTFMSKGMWLKVLEMGGVYYIPMAVVVIAIMIFGQNDNDKIR